MNKSLLCTCGVPTRAWHLLDVSELVTKLLGGLDDDDHDIKILTYHLLTGIGSNASTCHALATGLSRTFFFFFFVCSFVCFSVIDIFCLVQSSRNSTHLSIEPCQQKLARMPCHKKWRDSLSCSEQQRDWCLR